MKVKVIFPVFIITLFISATSVFAKGFVDPYFTYISTGHAKTQTGGGVGIGFNFLRDWYFVSKYSYSFTEKNAAKDKYGHMMIMAGSEYNYTIIPRLQARGTIMIGYSLTFTEIDDGNEDTEDRLSDSGPNIGAWLGLSFDINQWFSPFIDIGYHKSLYFDEFKSKNIAGFQILVGVRFVIFGQNKSIITDY